MARKFKWNINVARFASLIILFWWDFLKVFLNTMKPLKIAKLWHQEFLQGLYSVIRKLWKHSHVFTVSFLLNQYKRRHRIRREFANFSREIKVTKLEQKSVFTQTLSLNIRKNLWEYLFCWTNFVDIHSVWK